ncbi:MAG TPA: hypothetical protein EYP35_02690 [Desulfobacterales bacterium]|nr:hypothetical protein [Desulfobacterales bacterium]
MFIEDGGGTAYIQPYKKGLSAITLALSDPTGSVAINQMGPAVANQAEQTWIPYTVNGSAVVLNSDNTAKSIYAPIKLQIVATGTGVRMYNHGKP